MRLVMGRLGYANGVHYTSAGVVAAAQFTGEAVITDGEAPNALRNVAGDLTVGGGELADENAHLLFFAADELPSIERQAVCRLRRADVVDGDLVLASRRTNKAGRCAAPRTNGTVGITGLRDRRMGKRGCQRDAGEDCKSHLGKAKITRSHNV